MARMMLVDGRLLKMTPEMEAAYLASLPPPANSVPAEISDRQFAQQLAVLGAISEAEALAWAARGDLPAAVETAVDQLPEDERFSARMLLAAATSYRREHSLVDELGQALGYEPSEIDELWRAAALL